MKTTPTYVFTSDRLGFRPWLESDIEWYAEMNADKRVMQYFPSAMTKEDSLKSMQKLSAAYTELGHTYYVTELLESKEIIGFLGIGYQTFDIELQEFKDLGWRLRPKFWGHGYATEGAKRCIEIAFANEQLNLDVLYAITPNTNLPSIKVMQKIGMQHYKDFNHPELDHCPRLQSCVMYQLRR